MHHLPYFRRTELVLGAFFLSSFLAVNLATASRSPVIWQDEVMFADPAANLYFGNGFTTTAWFQSRTTLFAGNSPLYSLCLYLWISLFGFDVASIRSLNYVLIGAVGVIGLLALQRFGLVRSPIPRAVFLLLILAGDGVTYSYRSGRYDCLGMLLATALTLTLSFPHGKVRNLALLLLSTLVPWAGLQLLAYVALGGLLLLLLRGRSALFELLMMGAGCAAGLASLFVFFLENGVWREFVKSVAILSGARQPLAHRLVEAAGAPLSELSSILVLAALGVVLISALRRNRVQLRSPLVIGPLVGLLVPCLLALLSKYSRYYTWMAFIPMAGCLAAELESGRVSSVRRFVIPLVILACLAGLPARLAVACHEWTLRDPNPVDRFVAEQVRPSDWVYSEYEAYYPTKRMAAVVFLPPYAGLTPGMEQVTPPLSEAEKNRVDVLILKPATREETLQYFQGRWTMVGHYAADGDARSSIAATLGRGSKPYELLVYRRQREAVASAE
ncbi:MAG: hypothetical protein JO161_01220 [Planctomycetaceae bacterium]|nr:hypothetical protein [Planctomycetaceae bacterium]